jgi:hypothetical protein
MLSIKRPLQAEDIYGAKELAPGHPVFQLEGWGDGNSSKIDTIVIKNESGNTRNVQLATKMMSIVDSRSTQNVLTVQEVQQLRTWANSADCPNVETFRTTQAVAKALGEGGSWLKMELRQLMTLDSAVNNRVNQGDKADVRVIARALKKHGGLEKLGEIISADLFNGSQDRFAYPPMTQAQDGKYANIPLKVVQNVGNVFVACNGNGSGTPIGLDNFDPYGEQRHVDGAQAQNMDLSIHTWGGNLLLKTNGTQRNEFVKATIEDLEALLGGGQRNRKTRFGSQARLGTGRKRRLLKGIDSGAKKMNKAFSGYRKRAQGRNFSEGVARKLNTLGW